MISYNFYSAFRNIRFSHKIRFFVSNFQTYPNLEKLSIHCCYLHKTTFSLHSTDMLVDVYISQARAALEEKNLEKAESYLLRANRADIMLTYYREMGMWTEALRIAREYVPDMLAQVQVK